MLVHPWGLQRRHRLRREDAPLGQRTGMSLEDRRSAEAAGTMPDVFWPYRPREGFPSVPRWLMIALLIVAAIPYVAVLNLFVANPENGAPGG
jgi:hypothetical protein